MVKSFVKNRVFNSEQTISMPLCKKIYAWLFLLWPLLNIYGLFNESVGIGDILLFPASFGMLIFVPSSRNKNFNYFWFFIFSVSISLLGYATTGFPIQVSNFLSLGKYFFYVFFFSYVAPRFIDVDYLLKAYKTIVLFLCGILLLQLFFHYSMGVNLKPYLNNSVMPIRDVGGYASFIASYDSNMLNYGYKPSSLFSESAKFAQYCSPCLLLSLFSKRRSKYFLFEIIVSAFICSTFSANGVAYVAFIWLIWLWLSNGRFKLLRRILVLAGTFLLFWFYLFGNSEIWFMQRFHEIGSNSNNSGNMRLLRGWIIFSQLPLRHFLFGVGVGNTAQYITFYQLSTGFDAGYIGYMSGLSEIAVSGGILSLAMFVFLLIKYCLTKNRIVVSMSLLIVIMIIASAILNTPSFGIAIAIIESLAFKEGQHNEKNMYHHTSLHR